MAIIDRKRKNMAIIDRKRRNMAQREAYGPERGIWPRERHRQGHIDQVGTLLYYPAWYPPYHPGYTLRHPALLYTL